MSRWPKDHAEIDPFNPRAVALCDRCGRVWNRDVLQWRFQWQGMTTVNTGFLECPKCWCPPDNHARAYRIPPDPLPVNQPRPINADPQQTDYRVTLAERIGARARSRLFEMCTVIHMPLIEDYRIRQAKGKQF